MNDQTDRRYEFDFDSITVKMLPVLSNLMKKPLSL